jgi:hypothetical protein
MRVIAKRAGHIANLTPEVLAAWVNKTIEELEETEIVYAVQVISWGLLFTVATRGAPETSEQPAKAEVGGNG